MKRSNHLMAQILERDNLYLAFWKARKAKDAFAYVAEYRQNFEENLDVLAAEISSGNLDIGDYNYFKVYDPKERLICAAAFPERVLHHALMNICHDTFEHYQIYDSYASRRGKGQYAALDRAMYYQKKYKWFLKLDVRKFFDSIHHHTLITLLEKKFKERLLIDMFGQIISSYSASAGRGLPIGNLTSQYFANHYLAASDHYIKEVLNAKAYVRYMDDMVIWDNDKETLLDIGNQFAHYITNQLQLELKPFCLNKTHFGLPFLGYVVYQDNLRLNTNSKQRFKRKLSTYHEKLASSKWTEKEFQRRVLPLLAFTQKAESKPFRANCLII
jgi:retron-type reverse transcriptase